MNEATPSLVYQLPRDSHSRRDILRLAGGGVALLSAGRHLEHLAAQTSPTYAEVDALYDSAAAMPHLFAEFAFPFVRRNWRMYGRGTLLSSIDTAVASEAVTATDAALYGQPSTLYVASLINPEGESWSTARYLTIANYSTPDEATAAATRFVEAGVPAGGTDLTSNLDPSLGSAISYAMTVDLSGTPGEQVFSIFAAENWLFRYYSLTPQVASAAGNTLKARRLAVLPAAIGEDVADEALALAAFALTFSSPDLVREMLYDKGYTDEDINEMFADLFPSRFTATTGTRIDYVKHNNRDYFQFGMTAEADAMQQNYYGEAMCVVSDEGPIPPTNAHYYYTTKRFFHTSAEANAFFSSMPTPAQQISHETNGVIFQTDPESSSGDVTTSYLSWHPEGVTSTFPRYGFARVRGPIISHFNLYLIDPPADGPTQVDPANPLYQSLRSGVLDILEQQIQFESSMSSWPVYETPEAFSG